MRNPIALRAAALAGLLIAVSTPVLAGEGPPPNTGALSLTVVLNVPSSYYFRGIAQSNAGLHFQPYLELKATLYEGGEKDVVTAGFVKAAGFSHFQSIAPPITTNYYEQDVYLSGGLSFYKRLTLEGGWNLYAYPGLGSAPQVQEVFGRLALDDSGLWPFKRPGDQDFGLAPYVLLAKETSGGADGAGPSGGGKGMYFEVGIDPGISVAVVKDYPVRLHLPCVLGLSLDKYYEVVTAAAVQDKSFGFADLGIVVDIPLKFIPARYGKWTFSGGPHLLWPGQNPKLLAGPTNASALNGLNVTGGKGFEVWGVAGVKIEY
ncbi:MAG: hypothetical protein HY712_07890 [candidate division NC10 bacterium]|nr:hypothetical protein [candidate division NC10 bacterium]